MRSDNLAYNLQDISGSDFIDSIGCYRSAELRASDYFSVLKRDVAGQAYVPVLTGDFAAWKQNHVHGLSMLSGHFGKSKKPLSGEYRPYIQWLDHTGRLDNYLDRSVSYIFMRDLGKAPNSEETCSEIRQVVDKLKRQLTGSGTSSYLDDEGFMGTAGLYRKAQKEHIETAMIWVLDKLKKVSMNLPEGMDAEHAERKLIKIIAGVLLHETDGMDDNTPADEKVLKLTEALHLGYSYGITYPFIDDILDANVLSPVEKTRYSGMIRTALATGSVPELGEWPGDNHDLVVYVHSELREAFEYIKAHLKPEKVKPFFEQAYVFFHSQEVDRVKTLADSGYSNEDLFVPIILKSSSSRLIARSISSADDDPGFDERTFYYGIYNQLSDDFADMFDDLSEGAVTPYTYYLKYHESRPDLINPFELYWSVISNLIHNVYGSDARTCEVILDRAVNGLKRYRERMGDKKYNEVMALFTVRIPTFNTVVQKMVRKADDVDFFDKLLRDRMLTSLRNEKAERKAFEERIKSVKEQINAILPIDIPENEHLLDQTIVDAANYSLAAEGKRVRPVMAWVMCTDVYGLDQAAMVPLIRSLEYMHTASLIFDDTPSQDNANMRRGRPTLHNVYSLACAELAGLFLTQKAVEEQASLNTFDPASVLRLIRYSAGVVQDTCKGQAMDIDSKGRKLALEQLETMCFYKTGIAFEASLVMPAILAGVDETEMEALKKFARHTGIAFQIKDDLLDAEGDETLLGKAAGIDVGNGRSTFVTVLGTEAARKEMWDHYCHAIDALKEVPRNTAFLKQLLSYIINRDH